MANKKGVASFAYNAFFMSVFCLASSPVLGQCSPYAPLQQVSVSKIIDGDTVYLTDGRKIRLLGINTPEIKNNHQSGQPYGKKARQALVTSLNNRPTYLLTDSKKRDRYGRTLAHLYNGQKQNISAELLEQGWGFHIAIPPNLALSDCLAEAEQTARRKNLGVWGAQGVQTVAAKTVNTGGFQRVTGTVTRISIGKSAWWLSLDNKVAAVIYPDNQRYFKVSRLRKLIGTNIEIRGWVYPSRNTNYEPWRIKLETPFAIQ